jgi:CDP-paratose 2-epimerase
MKVILTGGCGFAGSAIAAGLLAARDGIEIIGVDNLSRPGSQLMQRPTRVCSGAWRGRRAVGN